MRPFHVGVALPPIPSNANFCLFTMQISFKIQKLKLNFLKCSLKNYAQTLIIQKAQFAKFKTSECVYNLYQLT